LACLWRALVGAPIARALAAFPSEETACFCPLEATRWWISPKIQKELSLFPSMEIVEDLFVSLEVPEIRP